jgi:pimeloyl-ACP methyl ester carboxylesterase
MNSFTSYDGVELAYTSLGEGLPLVCLPGGPGRSVAYLEDLGGLDRTRSLLMLDPRATGHSEVPADPATLRFDRMADDVEAFREHLKLERLDLLAHSAGALVAQAWASRFPSRVGHLVLVTPSDKLQGGSRSDLPQIHQSFADQPWYAEAAEAHAALEDAPPSQRASLERLTRPLWYARWDERAQQHAAGADHQCSKRAMLGFGAGVDEIDIAGLLQGLQRVTSTVVVIGGDRDGMTGVQSCHGVARSFPSSGTMILEEAGHYPWIDQPERFVGAVSIGLRTL